jgi:NAD(P) transhydrogenase
MAFVGYDYELLVIGSGPAGQKAAIQGAKLGRRVAVIERRGMVGGVCVNRGTIPSKTLREAVLYLTGLKQRSIYGSAHRVKEEITVEDLLERANAVIRGEVEVIRDQLSRNHVTLLEGTAAFADQNTLVVQDLAGPERRVSAETIIVAVGTVPVRPPGVAFDAQTVFDSDTILELERLPSSAVVVGAGVIGIEYASMLAALGTRVTVVEQRDRLLPFCDAEIVEGFATTCATWR